MKILTLFTLNVAAIYAIFANFDFYEIATYYFPQPPLFCCL